MRNRTVKKAKQMIKKVLAATLCLRWRCRSRPPWPRRGEVSPPNSGVHGRSPDRRDSSTRRHRLSVESAIGGEGRSPSGRGRAAPGESVRRGARPATPGNAQGGPRPLDDRVPPSSLPATTWNGPPPGATTWCSSSPGPSAQRQPDHRGRDAGDEVRCPGRSTYRYCPVDCSGCSGGRCPIHFQDDWLTRLWEPMLDVHGGGRLAGRGLYRGGKVDRSDRRSQIPTPLLKSFPWSQPPGGVDHHRARSRGTRLRRSRVG